MACVGEESDELDALRKRRFDEFAGLLETVHEPAEDSDHAKNDLVLGSKNTDWAFRWSVAHCCLHARRVAARRISCLFPYPVDSFRMLSFPR